MGLHSGCFFEDALDGLLDAGILIIQMNKDVLYCVLIKTGTPRIRQSIKEYLEDPTVFDSNPILCIIKSLEQLWINDLVVVLSKLGLDEEQDMLHKDHARETHVVVPVVFHGALQQSKQTAKILIQLLLINELLLDELYGTDDGCLSDAAVGLAGAPLN